MDRIRNKISIWGNKVEINVWNAFWRLYAKVQYKPIWAMSWENLFMPYANNKGTDQPAHSLSLIGAIVVRCLDSIILLHALAEISRP